LHFAIFFIGKIHFRFVFSRGAREAVKTAGLLALMAVEGMNKAAGFEYRLATCLCSPSTARQTVSVIDDPRLIMGE